MSTNLGDLLSKAGFQASESSPDAPEPTAPQGPLFGPKVVLRISRAGRRGKTVTEVQGVLRDHADLAKQLRKKLGVGVTAEAELLIVQGDQRKRLEPMLAEQGAKKIVLS